MVIVSKKKVKIKGEWAFLTGAASIKIKNKNKLTKLG